MPLVFFLKGIVIGAVIAVPVGPVGILCLRRTIFEGRLAGLVSGLGAATADALFGVVAAFAASPLCPTGSSAGKIGYAPPAAFICSIPAAPPCSPNRRTRSPSNPTRKACSATLL